MRKTINPYWKARLFWLFMAIVTIIAWLASGCNPAKVAARKDQQALDRVTTKPSLLQAAYARGAELWPCANDTTFVLKPGRPDSVWFPVMFDTADRDRIKDSIMAGMVGPMQDECNDKIKKAFDMGVEVTAKEFARIKIPVYRPDTLAGYIVDRRLAKNLLDSLNERRKDVAYWQGRAAEWENSYGKQVSEKLRLFWALLAVIALFVGSNVAWVLYKTRKPL